MGWVLGVRGMLGVLGVLGVLLSDFLPDLGSRKSLGHPWTFAAISRRLHHPEEMIRHYAVGDPTLITRSIWTLDRS